MRCDRQGSNLRRPAFQASALPAELRSRDPLDVHRHPMPAPQHDRGVIRVSDRALSEHVRPAAVGELDQVQLATPAREWLVEQHQRDRRMNLRCGTKNNSPWVRRSFLFRAPVRANRRSSISVLIAPSFLAADDGLRRAWQQKPAPLRPSPNPEDRRTGERLGQRIPRQPHTCAPFASTSNDLSKPLAYPSTLDHRHTYRRDDVLRGGALEPGARSGVRRIAGVSVHLKCQVRLPNDTRGPFSLRRGLKYS